MTESDLKDRLTAILLEEDQKSPNWQDIEAMCLQLSIALRADPCDACPIKFITSSQTAIFAGKTRPTPKTNALLFVLF